MRHLCILFFSLMIVSCTVSPEKKIEQRPYVKETYTLERYDNITTTKPCHYKDIQLKENMPPLPKIPAGVTDDNKVGDYLIANINALRDYIKQKDYELAQQQIDCK